MKKNEPIIHDAEILPEYDFSGGIRGKHFKAMQSGYTITIHQKDGSTVIKEVEPRKRSSPRATMGTIQEPRL